MAVSSAIPTSLRGDLLDQGLAIKTENLTKSYVMDAETVHALRGVDLSIRRGEYIAIMGPSGSGKSTLMNLIGCLDAPTSGRYWLAGKLVSDLDEDQLAHIRNQEIGFIFQTFNLLQGYTCLENVLLGMSFGPGVDRDFAESLLKRVGLQDRLGHRPRQLSTGQQQRVAVARALANKPKLVLADEPTGNLDHKNARDALALVREACRENGAALLLVSHDREVLGQFEDVRDFHKINQAIAKEAAV